MKSFKRIALASIIRRAKDLSDDEILSLYHAVKEKLNPASQEDNQVLEGDQSGTEPQTKPEDNADQAGDGDGQGTDSIDSLLDDLGLGENSEDTLAPSTAPADTQAETPSQPSATEPEKPESTPAPAAEPEPAKDDLKTPVMDIPTPASKPEEKTATEDPNSDITAPETPIPSLPPEDNDKAVQELLGINLEEATEPEVKESDDGDGEDNEMIQRLTQKIIDDDPYSPKNFKTASQGLQLNRKDKDTMSDGIVKPKYEETEFRPPREDRDPNGERYKKNEKNRDPDVDSDPDMKTASGNWSQYLKYIPESIGGFGEYYTLDIPVGVEPPKEGDRFDLGRSSVVVQTVESPEDIAKGKGGPVANFMRRDGIAYKVNCLPEGHKWLMPKAQQ